MCLLYKTETKTIIKTSIPKANKQLIAQFSSVENYIWKN